MKILQLLLLITAALSFSNALNRDEVRHTILSKRSVTRLESGAFFYDKSSSNLLLRKKRSLTERFPAFTDDEDFEDSSTESSGDVYFTNEGGREDDEAPFAPRDQDFGWQRAKINLLDSVAFNSDLEDHNSDYFAEVAFDIMTHMESYLRLQLTGYSEATPIMFRLEEGNVIVTVDIGMCGSQDPTTLEPVVYALVQTGVLGQYRMSTQGFQMNNLGLDPDRPECIAAGPAPTARTPVHTRVFTAENLVDEEEEERSTRAPVRPTSSSTTSTAETPDSVKLCRPDQATCRNFQCIDRNRICDGHADCSDGSDEPPTCDGTHRQCAPEEFLCVGTDECKQKIWRCDGDIDCSNGFDEDNCPTAAPGSACASTEFQCPGDGSCIPLSYLCDKEADCNDESDERGCSQPTVTRHPQRFINATEGDDIVLECESVGFPTPVITWRVNWDNVPSPPRVTMTSVNGLGTLTVRNIQISDQGAYSCQAMNTVKTKLATPDAIVNVMPKAEPLCPPGQFLTEDYYGEEICKPCYCSGVSETCHSASGSNYKEISTDFEEPDDDDDVTLQPIELSHDDSPKSPVNKNQIVVNPDSNELQLIDLSKRFLAAAHYWSLPAQFLGAKIESYGGTLKYSFSYNTTTREEPKPIESNDLVLEGKDNKKLYFKNEGHPSPGRKHTVDVPLEEKYWKTEEGDQATRTELMDVLQGLNRVLIRTIYDGNMLSTGIGKIKLNNANARDYSDAAARAGGILTAPIEVCECPPQYAGSSCQMCAEGYARAADGSCQPDTGRGAEDEDEKVEEFTPGTLEIVEPSIVPPHHGNDEDDEDCCDEGYTGEGCTECAEGYEMVYGICTRLPLVACNSIGTSTVNIDNSCNCKTGCAGEHCDRCRPGFFNFNAENIEGCISCYCSGVTSQCDSSELSRHHVQPDYNNPEAFVITVVGSDSPNQLAGRVVMIKQSEGDVETQPSVTVELDDVSPGHHYWSLRGDFVGNRLTSYGGNFDYAVSFRSWRNGGARRVGHANVPITDVTNVLLEGNGITLHHIDEKPLEMDIGNRYTVKMREQFWTTEYGHQATRDELMKVLANVERFLIRASYLNGPISSTLTDVYLETAVSHRTNRPRAFEVEQCQCPAGYVGLSCETCADGYEEYMYQDAQLCRVIGGEDFQCNCNGHSAVCDPYTGNCLHCRGNTAGDHCERCVDGYFLDPYRGACTMCPCGQEGIKCTLDKFNNPHCEECPQGYAGAQCNLCAEGYQIDEQFPDEVVCITVEQNKCNCDQVGSLGDDCDDYGQCECHEDFEGQKCSNCKTGHFSYNIENPDGKGCTPCFCMGITQDCSVSNLKRVQITADFSQRKFNLTDMDQEFKSSNFSVPSNGGRELFYPGLNLVPYQIEPFWRFDEEFLGDKVISYGGKLDFEVTNLPSEVTTRRRFRPKILIRGNNITLQAIKIKKEETQVDVDPSRRRFITKFKERSWQHYYERTPATREDMLMVLADLDMMLVQARFSSSQVTSGIARVTMETAKEDDLRLDVAFAVEKCNCPNGYEGFSCEDCAPGYTRNFTGEYLGFCQKCECNSQATQCESASGSCMNCHGHTTGASCENCEPGYYRYHDEPKSNPCRPCHCPALGSTNCTSSRVATCSVDTSGQVSCDECPPGYAGRKCASCADGYESNPRIAGGECLEVNARLEEDGSVPSVEVFPKNAELRNGESITLNCQVESYGAQVEIKWRRLQSNGQSQQLPDSAVNRAGGRQLELRNFREEDAGNFQCVVTNKYGKNQDTATILFAEPYDPIRVQIQSPTMQHVRVGSRVQFICIIESNTLNYDLTWERLGNRLPDGSTVTDGHLVVDDVQADDGGLYLCIGRDDHGGMNRAAAHLIITGQDKMPTVEVTPDRMEVAEGKSAMFHCKIDGVPRPKVEWRRADGRPMPLDAKIRDDYLLIPSTSMNDNTLYYCRAYNQYGVAEATAELQVTVVSEPLSISIEPASPLELYVGDSRTVRCLSPGRPLPQFGWTRDGSDIGLGENVEQGGGYLRFSHVTEHNEGLYTCTAQNKYNVATTQLSVIVRTRVRKPLCRTELKEVTFFVGMNSTIKCDVGGEPLPVVTWEGVNGSSIQHNMVVEGNDLIIVNVSRANAGTYVCVATNRYGASRSPVRVNVEKKDLPEVNIQPSSSLKYEEGSVVTLTCTTDQAEATLKWKRADGAELSNYTSVSEDGSVLRIEAVRLLDGGKYRCIASNQVGHRYVTAHVKVVARPLVTVQPLGDVVELTVGEPLELRCAASGVPTPSVIWRKRSEHGSDPQGDVRLTKYRKAQIRYVVHSVQASHAGVYICSGTNSVGTEEGEVLVKVRPFVDVGAPPTIELHGATSKVIDATLVSGQDLHLQCSAHGEPTPTIAWVRMDGEFPSEGEQVGSELNIAHANSGHSGNYTCHANNENGHDFVTYRVNVLEPPVVEILPGSDVALRVGEDATVTCQMVSGSRPVRFEWTRNEEERMSSNVEWKDNLLQVSSFNPLSDSGRYICTATNEAGSGVAAVQVFEVRPPLVVVSPSHKVGREDGVAIFSCSVALDDADPIDVNAEWSREDGEWDHERMTVENEVLTILDLRPSDSGKYFCTADNDFGSTRSFALLTVDYPPQVSITVNEEKDTYEVGDRIEIECSATGQPEPWVALQKDGVNAHEFESENGRRVYVVEYLTSEDSGKYSCLASNDAGQQHSSTIDISTAGTEPVFPDSSTHGNKRVKRTSGEKLILHCNVGQQSPKPSYRWYKGNSTQPLADADESVPLRKRVYLNDAGLYECRTRSGTRLSQFHLVVEADIPLFTQTPLSYTTIGVETADKLYQGFNITISFRASSLQGILLYMDSKMEIDFFSLALNQGFVEFRFNAGSGTFLARSKHQVEMHKWHTVFVSRDYRVGKLRLDDEPEVVGNAPGEFRGLDLDSDLFVGGVPDDKRLHSNISFMRPSTGFYGCISQLHFVYPFSPFENFIDFQSPTTMTKRVGIFSCNTCSDESETRCENGADCVYSNEKMEGYQCDCGDDLIGDKCQFRKSALCRDSCNSHGTCNIDLTRKSGFMCVCEHGYSGATCQTPPPTSPPQTTRPPPTTQAHVYISAIFQAKPKDQALIVDEEGLVSVQEVAPTTQTPEEFREARPLPDALSFDGSSYSITRPATSTRPHRRIQIEIRIRRASDADSLIMYQTGNKPGEFISFSVKNGAVEFRYSFGSDVAVARSDANLLGVGSWHTIQAIRKKKKGMLYVDGKLVGRAKSQDKSEGLMQLDGMLYIGGYDNMNEVTDIVQVDQGFIGCLEGLRINEGLLSLPNDFDSTNTETCVRETGVPSFNVNSAPIQHAARFTHSSYAAYAPDVFAHNQIGEIISFRMKTFKKTGLILFHGEELNVAVSSYEDESKPTAGYVEVGLKNGTLSYGFDLGGDFGHAQMSSRQTVSDGKWHKVTVLREGLVAHMWVDDDINPAIARATSALTSILDAPGRLYIGGARDVIYATSGRYTNGFVGCLHNIRLETLRTTTRSRSFSPSSGNLIVAPIDLGFGGTLERIDVRECKLATGSSEE